MSINLVRMWGMYSTLLCRDSTLAIPKRVDSDYHEPHEEPHSLTSARARALSVHGDDELLPLRGRSSPLRLLVRPASRLQPPHPPPADTPPCSGSSVGGAAACRPFSPRRQEALRPLRRARPDRPERVPGWGAGVWYPGPGGVRRRLVRALPFDLIRRRVGFPGLFLCQTIARFLLSVNCRVISV